MTERFYVYTETRLETIRTSKSAAGDDARLLKQIARRAAWVSDRPSGFEGLSPKSRLSKKGSGPVRGRHRKRNTNARSRAM